MIRDAAPVPRRVQTSPLLKTIWACRYFYLMLLPVVAFYVLFCYAPIYGITLAFKTYQFNKGILGSPWIGFKNFVDIVSDHQFLAAFRNTVIISAGTLLINFPSPIILAVLLNEITRNKVRKLYQTVFTFPHFVSWIVMAGIIINLFGQDGVYNQITGLFGAEPSSPLVDPRQFRWLLFFTQMWKEIGWDSIIYLAAMAGISSELYEAAEIDGANHLQRIVHITWPGIRGTVAILLVLNIGALLNGGGGFEQIFNLYSAPVYGVADVIDTYIYRTTFTVGTDYGYMTAVGLLRSSINLCLLVGANWAVKKMGEQGLF